MCCHGYKNPLVLSRLKEEERKIANMEISFSPLELRYLATCHHTPSIEKGHKLEDLVFENIKKYALNGKGLSAKGITLITYFPLLGNKIVKDGIGLREDKSFLLYFESLEPWSHNLALRKIFGNILKSSPYSEKFSELREHVDSCSVRLGEIDKKGSILVYSPLYGKREEKVDLETFLKDKNPEFFTVHGNKAVRELERKNDKKIIDELKNLPKVWRK